MSSSAPAPSLDDVLTLLDASAAFARISDLTSLEESTPGLDAFHLQLVLDAAYAEARVQAVRLLQVVESNSEWISTSAERLLTDQIAGASASSGLANWLPQEGEDSATIWARRLAALIGDRTRPSACDTALHHLRVETALCTLIGAHCVVAAHAAGHVGEVCFADHV